MLRVREASIMHLGDNERGTVQVGPRSSGAAPARAQLRRRRPGLPRSHGRSRGATTGAAGPLVLLVQSREGAQARMLVAMLAGKARQRLVNRAGPCDQRLRVAKVQDHAVHTRRQGCEGRAVLVGDEGDGLEGHRQQHDGLRQRAQQACQRAQRARHAPFVRCQKDRRLPGAGQERVIEGGLQPWQGGYGGQGHWGALALQL
mmetsp:Transcript_56385/g.171752  ORF Transcript_56385/g.171752 Transcript_56385/m.171752 type:complete len:202 (-) Transcript_56385:1500-2105(-)